MMPQVYTYSLLRFSNEEPETRQQTQKSIGTSFKSENKERPTDGAIPDNVSFTSITGQDYGAEVSGCIIREVRNGLELS